MYKAWFILEATYALAIRAEITAGANITKRPNSPRSPRRCNRRDAVQEETNGVFNRRDAVQEESKMAVEDD